MTRIVVGVYDDMKNAQKAVEDLEHHGFRRDDISLVASDEKGNFRKQMGEKAGNQDVSQGAAGGAGIGAALGGIGGLLVGLGLLTIPGIGPILAAGPIATTLAGAGIGAVTGGIVGALVDMGIPEDQARAYEQSVRAGNILLTVTSPDEKTQQAVDILDSHHPIDVHDKGSREHTMKETRERRDIRTGKDEVTLPVTEEELRVGKREVDKGGVRVESTVEETPVEKTVNLREEHVEVERHPVDRPVSPEDVDAFREDTIEIPEKREEVVADKRAHVVEEVTVRKDVEEHPETVRDTIRRTDVNVEDLHGETNDYDQYFREHFNNYYNNTSYTYDQYRPYYEYGYQMASSNRFRGRTWNQAESDVRTDWERTHPNSTWEDVKDAVQAGWDRVSGQR